MKTQLELENMVREVLGDEYVALAIQRYSLTEDIASRSCQLTCAVIRAGDDPPSQWTVEGTGVGMINALFRGLKDALVPEYPSLDHIHFADFSISGDFSHPQEDQAANSTAEGVVRLVVENTSGRLFEFKTQSRSISASSVQVVLDAVQHFVNAELAVLKVYGWIEDAKKRNRPSIADQYVHMLSELVKNASYSESIERTRQATGL